MVEITWLSPDDFTRVKLVKTSGEILNLKIGDFITFAQRPDGVRLLNFVVKESDMRGPKGVDYLPWRKEEARWATPRMSMRGNDHHIICYPVGTPHYGSHIDWNSVEIGQMPVQQA